MNNLQAPPSGRKRLPTIKIRRVIGPHWITGQRGRFRYAVKSYTVKTTAVSYNIGGGL